MRYRALGDSGLLVSVVGLGCNNFGRRLDVDADPGGGRRRASTRDHAVRHGRHLRRRGRAPRNSLGEVLRGPPGQGRAGHQVRQPVRGPGLRPGRGRQGRPRLHPPGRREVPAPAADRLHRPVPDAHPRPGRPRSRRPWPRSTSWSARARSATSVTRTSPAGRSPRPPARPASWARPVHLRAEPLVAAGARRRGRGRPRRPALRPRRAAVLPAGQRPADRQGPERPAGPGGHPAGRAARTAT